MQLSDLTLEVRDRTLQRKGQITGSFMNFQARKRWCNVGEWTLTLPGDHSMVPYLLEKGSGIILTGPVGSIFHPRTASEEPYYETVYGPILSGPTWRPQRVRNRQNPDGTFTFTGHTDEIHLLGALAFPDPQGSADPDAQTKANDTRSGKTETLMRQYLAYNIAYTHAPAGRIRGARQYLTLEGSDLTRGITQKKSPRFQPLLELLQELTLGDPNYGFEVVQVDDLLRFRVVAASDRRDTIRLDVENGTITSEEVQMQGPTVTDAIVGGQGEGTARTIVQRTTPEAEAAEAEWGLVWERFIDQRDTDDLLELQQSGDEALEDGRGGTSVKMLPSDDSTMQYGRDWVVGDLLTTVVLGVETVARSTEAVFIADPSAVMVGTAIGDVSGFTASDAAGSKVESLDERVARLERLEASASSRNPPGAVMEYAGSTAPEGWLLCQGQSLLRSDYPTLFAAIGTTYGSADSTHFNVPNTKGRVVVGLDTSQSEFNALNEKAGAKTHTLSLAEMPSHSHAMTRTTAGGSGITGTGIPPHNNAPAGGGQAVTDLVGSGSAHNNLQPYIVMNHIIKT
jgi:microcystin-dependent protein